MLEPARRANGVNATEEAADPLAIVLGPEFRPLPAAARVQRKTKASVFQQGSRWQADLQRRDDRNLGGGKLQRETVFFEDCCIAPASRAIELHDDRFGVLETDLIDTILIASEREYPAVTGKACGLDCFDDGVRRQRRKRNAFKRFLIVLHRRNIP